MQHLLAYWFGAHIAPADSALELDMRGIAGDTKSIRQMIYLTLAVLEPCGLMFAVLRCVLRSSSGRRFLKGVSIMKKLALISGDHFYFYEKNTGVLQFKVEATPDGCFPVDEAAGLLAMHCMVFGQSPCDYMVMVSAEIDALKGLTEKAEKLLRAGHSARGHAKLTRREEEVLGGVMRRLANKEIAASLNLSERTVKFHVSSLFAKFRVSGRMELVREATRHIAGSMSMPVLVGTRVTRSYAPVLETCSNPAQSADVVPLAKRQMTA